MSDRPIPRCRPRTVYSGNCLVCGAPTASECRRPDIAEEMLRQSVRPLQPSGVQRVLGEALWFLLSARYALKCRLWPRIKSVLATVVVFICIYAVFAWEAAIHRLRSEGRGK